MREIKLFWNHFNPFYLVKMNFIIAAAFVATAVVSAGAAIAQGQATQRAEEQRRRQIDSQIKQQNIQSLDDENERRRKLLMTLGTQAAMGAQSGFDPFATGTSFLAVKEETEKVAQQDIDAIRLLQVNQIGNFSRQKIESRIVGKNAKIQGFLSAGQSLIGGYIGYQQLTTPSTVGGRTATPGQWNSAGRQNRQLS